MAAIFTPYTYIQCPCSDSTSLPGSAAHESNSRPSSSDRTTSNANGGGGAGGGGGDSANAGTEEDDHTFDPRSPRANYSLYPLEYLLYCEDCHQIRCPRCVAEEIVTYYCPNCLFEVPTSNLKSEGNRCTRSCFQCPVCIAPLTVTNLETPSSSSSSANLAVPEGNGSASSHAGSFLLSCSFCQWSSTEVGIKFDKANGLYGQLAKVRNGGKARLVPKEQKAKRRELASPLSSAPSLLSGSGDTQSGGLASSPEAATGGSGEGEEGLDLETQYAHLKQFYQRQLSEANGGGVGGLSSFGDLSFGSPSSLSRIMNMYTSGMAGSGSRFDKKAQSRIRSMRDARDESEGFQAAVLDESAAIARLHGQDQSSAVRHHHHHQQYTPDGWDMTTSSEQRAAQMEFIGDNHLHGRSRFLDELRPIPFLLRTKRSKRCPICRHIISKPEAKSTNNRFRIRLVAGSYIPSISIKPLQSGSTAVPVVSGSSRSAAVAAAAAAAAVPTNILEPLKPVQYILTFKNPIFESVKVTLATPSTTPGRFASKVTVLCPQFEIDSNTDVWDDALRDSVAGGGSSGSGSAGGSRSRRGEDGGQQQVIPGKIWERGRNWVSIVVEVVPPSLNLDLLAMTSKPIGKTEGESKQIDLSPLREDEDIVEIPMFVRVEWETDAGQDGVGVSSSKDNKDAKEKRELAYWCVLGLGRVRND
ncbi:hypothetical protein SBRCBS47491_005476 [Sporothrix bragantina]|uniref:Dynactin subunit 4 n=1 Tax=Sporothrix bragantina TaxID=671064 RepID=A0ABP0BX97_9PEZI